MFGQDRIPFTHPDQIPRWRGTWTRYLPPLCFWMCAAMLIRVGCYGDRHMVLGPSSSRMMKASAVFAEQLKVRDENGTGVLVYGFSEEPELNKEANWSYSSYLTVGSYDRKGYSLWLNKGSKICMRWTTQTSRSDQTEVVLVKGRIGEDTLLPKMTIPFFSLFLNEPVTGEEAEYTIDEDGTYSVGVINWNPRTTKMTLNVTVTAMVYDVTKATSVCSTRNGSCFLDLHFPNTHYVVVSTPDNSDVDGRYVKLTYDSRDVSYIGLLGLFIIMMLLLLKAQESCHSEFDRRMMTDPILPKKPVRTNDTSADEDNDDGSRSSSSSSADLNDAQLCIICYEDQRNCFFVPCGHSATCYECAKRVMEEDNKMCPICRKQVRKARKLFTP